MKSQVRADIVQRFLKAYRMLYVDGHVKTKKDFCDQINLKPQNFSQIEQGRLSCTLENIYFLAQRFGISLEWLFFEAGEFYQK